MGVEISLPFKSAMTFPSEHPEHIPAPSSGKVQFTLRIHETFGTYDNWSERLARFLKLLSKNTHDDSIHATVLKHHRPGPVCPCIPGMWFLFDD